jgi:hypothetical protein
VIFTDDEKALLQAVQWVDEPQSPTEFARQSR